MLYELALAHRRKGSPSEQHATLIKLLAYSARYGHQDAVTLANQPKSFVIALVKALSAILEKESPKK
jgi:hypothetical protein